MALPNVEITVVGGGLGRVSANTDGVAGLVLTNKVSTPFPIGTVKLFTSAKQVEELSSELTSFAKRELLDFYKEAGEGAELYVLPVADTVDIEDVSASHFNSIVNASSGTVALIGVSLNPADPALEGETSIAKNFSTALGAIQTAINASTALIKPYKVLVGLYGFDIADLSTLPSRESLACPGVSVVLNCPDDSGLPTVGLFLGRASAVSIATNLGRVKDGPVQATAAYVGGEKVEASSSLSSLDTKGYLFLRSFPGRSGYYIQNDHTMTKTSDDLSSLARGRVIDKALKLVYDTYVDEINDSVKLDSNGRLDIGIIKYLEGIIETRINREMGDEISSVSAFIDPEQNVLSNDKLKIQVGIVPLGYLKEIQVELGFLNPFQ